MLNSNMFTAEFIDVDGDSYPDLLVSGHEHQGQPSAIYWGDESGTYEGSRKTILPEVLGQGVVVDIDAEDLDGDGDRDIVLNRAGDDPLYIGYYIQVIMNRGSRRFIDETAERIRSGARATSDWLVWVRLEDVDNDGDKDIWIDDTNHLGLTWINDGSGRFTQREPFGFAPIDSIEFSIRFACRGDIVDAVPCETAKRFRSDTFSVTFLHQWRFIDHAYPTGPRGGNTYYEPLGKNTGRVWFDYGDPSSHCTLILSFDSETSGTLEYTCRDGRTGTEDWRLERV